jgi:peptidoglycan hydrolase CwlO-like protein
MEQRIERLEQEHRALKTRLDALERSRQGDDFLLRDIAHKMTIAQGLATTTSDDLRDFKLTMQERLSRLDDRVTEAHTELAELSLKVDKVDKKQEEHTELLNQHTELLNQHTELLKLILAKLS